MTRNDKVYLAAFTFVALALIAAIYVGSFFLIVIFSVHTALFTIHLFLNIVSGAKTSYSKVESLLDSILSETQSSSVLNDPQDPDYSQFNAFCDTPIVTDGFLNDIRVKAYNLLNNGDLYFALTDDKHTMFVTEAGKIKVQELLTAVKEKKAKDVI